MVMRRLFFSAALAAVLLCVPSPSPAADAPPADARLVKVVALSRHGVRPPTQSAETLASWSSRQWPDWGIPPGHLSERGAALIRAEWEGMRNALAFNGLLPASGCPEEGSIFIYADNEERTLATARAMLEGLAPGCGMEVSSAPEGRDPVFHPVKSGFLPSPQLSAEERQELARTVSAAGRDLEQSVAKIASLLGPAPRFCVPGRDSCTLADLPSRLHFPAPGSRQGVSLSGGLGTASTVAEILLLESLEWPEKAQAIAAEIPAPLPAGPGTPVERKAREIMVNPRTALQLLPVHTRLQSAVQRFPAVARQEGLPLLSLMAESLAGTSPMKSADAARLVVFSGHDTNMVNIAGLLDLHWTNGLFPDDSTPPGSLLVLSLWETPDGPMVQASFLCQTPAAFLSTDPAVMRASALHHAPLVLPGAYAHTPAGPAVPLEDFLSRVRSMTGSGLSARLAALLQHS